VAEKMLALCEREQAESDILAVWRLEKQIMRERW
jgi:hypothetical protein